MMLRNLSGKRVTVAGLGHFGGNIAAARWLAQQGAKVLVTDRSPADKLQASLDQLAGLPIEYRLGGHEIADFNQVDLVVASPAIPPSNQYLAAARSMGVPVTTEICLFLERCPAPVVGVTGTKGKSTTSSMLGQILSKRFKTWFGGNIGKSLLDELPNIKRDHVVVLELSSFMLHYTGENFWSPHVAVVTLLVPDHLDWHGKFNDYAEAKRNIVRFQKPGDVAVINEEAVELRSWFPAPSSNTPGEGKAVSPNSPDAGLAAPEHAKMPQLVLYGVDSRPPFDLAIPGRHNQLNAQGAYAAAAALGVTRHEADAALREYKGLPHRLQLVHEANGIRWFNDSIATVPEAAVAALTAFDIGRVIQIVGGSDKGLDMSPMVDALSRQAKAALTIGSTGAAVAERLRRAGLKTVQECETLPQAVAAAKAIAQPGDVVLLSTGFASYDQFTNFEDRGEQFATLART